jgi:hypothetical protein
MVELGQSSKSAENTRTDSVVNDFVYSLRILKYHMDNVTKLTLRLINDSEIYHHIWHDITMHDVILHENLNAVKAYITKFKLMISTALLGQVTPVLIEPMHLRLLLTQIKEHINVRFQLPFDIDSQIHEYYQQISSDVIVLEAGLGIVFSVPLVSIDSRFHIFKAFNVPVPYANTSFVFTYDVQHSYLALSHDRSKFVYLIMMSMHMALYQLENSVI